MKVTVCPICRVTPEITNTKLTCPKCGRTAVGEYLEDTVTKWNAGIVTTTVTTEKVTEAVINDEEAPKEEIREEIEDEIKEEPKKPALKKAAKPVEKAPVKKTNKRGMK